MVRPGCLLRTLAAVTILAAAACSTKESVSTLPDAAPAPSGPTPIPVYTLERPEHRTPVAIDWHADSGSFFVGTHYDGTHLPRSARRPTVRLFLEGRPGQAASGIVVAHGRLYVSGGIYGDIRVHDLETKALVGTFNRGQGGFLNDLVVTDAGDVYITDAGRPVLWHLTPEQVAAGSGSPTAIPLSAEIRYIRTPDNVEGIVALTDTRLVVVKYDDGTLYRIDLDDQAADGRVVTPITGATARLGSRMILDGRRLVIADEEGISVVELDDDASRGTMVAQVRDPSFRDTTSVVRVDDRYLVVNAAWNEPAPYTVSSVPAVR
jgi:hypothetical protein